MASPGYVTQLVLNETFQLQLQGFAAAHNRGHLLRGLDSILVRDAVPLGVDAVAHRAQLGGGQLQFLHTRIQCGNVQPTEHDQVLNRRIRLQAQCAGTRGACLQLLDE